MPYDHRKHYAVHRRGMNLSVIFLLIVALATGYYVNELHHPVTLDFCATTGDGR